jgi:cytochrome c oxidase assembly protein subunit 15
MIASVGSDSGRYAIRIWLYAVAMLIFAMVLLGGATRLTESGLSITEWQPVIGTLPPLSDSEWKTEFDKYKAIPQFKVLNSGMTLSEFRAIFWWEWTHRLLGRLIGVIFLLPLLFFLWRGWIGRGLRKRLLAIFALGALQGAVGWWMVASGLADRVEVSEYRLATHLVLACLIYTAVVWTAVAHDPRAMVDAPKRLRACAVVLIVLILIQISFGALLAGLRGGPIFPTWPLIDGSLIPSTEAMLTLQPVWRNLFENVLTVQVEHRLMAYALWLFAIIHAVDITRTLGRSRALIRVLILAAAVTIQAVLGILTLIFETPLALALMHQATAMAVLTIAVVHTGRLVVHRGSYMPDRQRRGALALKLAGGGRFQDNLGSVQDDA